MNEKIKRLLQQIKGETYSPLGLYTIHGTSNLYGMTELEINQFAELIVKECAKLAQGDRGGDEYWRARASSRADILKHFGVEE